MELARKQQGRPLTYPKSGLKCTHHKALTCPECKPLKEHADALRGICQNAEAILSIIGREPAND